MRASSDEPAAVKIELHGLSVAWNKQPPAEIIRARATVSGYQVVNFGQANQPTVGCRDTSPFQVGKVEVLRVNCGFRPVICKILVKLSDGQKVRLPIPHNSQIK